MFDITTGTGDFIANGVVSHNCFARRTHTYLDLDAGRDFEREIVVKVNVPELVRAELARPSWKRELVALGTNTDPYQWVESRYRMMPEILEALEAAETPVSVLTKSPLAMRDVEIFERMAKQLPVSVNLSVPTLDEDAWRATEPHTPSPAARLDAVAELRRRGIDSGVLIAPLMPGINDTPRPGPPDRRARPQGRRHLPRRRRPPPPRRGQGRLPRLAGGKTPRPPAPIRAALQRPRLHAARPAQAGDPSRPWLGPRTASAARPADRPKTQLDKALLGQDPPASDLCSSPLRPTARTCTPAAALSSRNRWNRAPCRIRPEAAWS